MSAVASIAFASCEKKTTTSETTVEPTTETEVVHETTVATPDTVVVKNEETDGTNVNVSSDGIKVDSKDADKKTNVEVNVKK